MLPEPLHPAVVHLPIALAVLLPLLTILGALAIGRGVLEARSWSLVVLLQLVLAGSAWVAVETGESEEERVEEVIEHAVIHEHEEAAERLLLAAALGVPLLAAGLLRGRAGAAARAIGAGFSLLVLAAAIWTGHLGGELVWKHGATRAYLDPGPGDTGP